MGLNIQWTETKSPEDALAWFLTEQSEAIEEGGYEIASQSPRSIEYTRRHLSAKAFVLGLLIFPVGILVWLFYRQNESFRVSTFPEEDRTVVNIGGEMRSNLGSAFSELATERNARYELSKVQAPSETPSQPAPQSRQGIDSSEMESELKQIYDELGAASAFPEARGKVEALARDLAVERSCAPDEALYLAYRRSLDEHREFLRSKRAAAHA